MSTKFRYHNFREMTPYDSITDYEASINCPFCTSFSGQVCHAMHPHIISSDLDKNFTLFNSDERDVTAEEDYQNMLSSVGYHEELNISFKEFKNHTGFIISSKCRSCEKTSIWYKGHYFEELLFPKTNSINLIPNQDLSEAAKKDFNEAISVLDISPRSSAALARLTLEKMLKDLNIKGNDINLKIQTLVDNGLSPTIQQSLDIVRVVGNNAVHPGKMDITDDTDTATTILKLINVIAETLITIPKQVESVYQTLPEGSRNAIEKRNS